MILGELTQHPDWHRFLSEMQNRVDKARGDVLVASTRDSVETVRYRAGYYDALQLLYRDLKGGAL